MSPLFFHEPCYLLYNLELAPAPDRGNQELPRHIPAEPVYDDIASQAFNAFYHHGSVLFKTLRPDFTFIPERFEGSSPHYLELVELYALYWQTVEECCCLKRVLLSLSGQAYYDMGAYIQAPLCRPLCRALEISFRVPPVDLRG